MSRDTDFDADKRAETAPHESNSLTDKMLRAAGFEVIDRPKDSDPIWRRREKHNGRWIWVEYSEANAWWLLSQKKR